MGRSSTNAGRDRPSTGNGTGAGDTSGTGPTGAAALDGHMGAADQVVNDAALQLELDAAIAAAPVDLTGAPPAAAGPDPADMEAGYAELAGAALGMTFELTCPAWEITDDEKDKFAVALGKACALWFPGDIPEKWIALIIVAGVGGRIVAARRDPLTGGFKPRFKPAARPAPAGAPLN
jgi:hypothetical protein